MLPASIADLVSALAQHPRVIGLIEFGVDHAADQYRIGDYDLFAVLHGHAGDVSSLHFYAGSVPVDLNVITLAELEQLTARDFFRWTALRDGRIIHDPHDRIAPALQRLQQRHAAAVQTVQPVSAATIARTRHWFRHMLDKLRGRAASDPVVCRFILSSTMSRLIATYFQLRQQPIDGDIRSLTYLRQHEPALFHAIERFYATLDLDTQTRLLAEISDAVLAPVGGLPHDDDVIAFGGDDSTDLQAQGRALLHDLFGTPGANPSSGHP